MGCVLIIKNFKSRYTPKIWEAAAERTATCLEHRSAVNNCRGSTPPASVIQLGRCRRVDGKQSWKLWCDSDVVRVRFLHLPFN